MAHLSIGTSSWQFEGWRGVFYPEDLPKDQQLVYYTGRFNTVEVNTSFYGLPRPTTIIKWVQTAPPGFTFCLKAPRLITHDKRLVGCQEETLAFLEVLRSLGEAAAPAFLQFPASFTRKRDGKVLADYIDWLAQEMTATANVGIRLAVEVRAQDLLTPAFAKFLAERGMAMVLVDRVETADCYDAWLELITSPKAPTFAMIRWIGDDEKGPQGDREISVWRDEQLAQWAQRIVTLFGHGVDVFGYMHNPYEGHSPASVRRLLKLIEMQITVPVWPPVPTPKPGQQSLFA